MCRTVRHPDSLRRVVLDGERLEAGRLLPGRGAWVCAESVCVARLHEKALSRALRRTVTAAAREDLQRRLA